MRCAGSCWTSKRHRLPDSFLPDDLQRLLPQFVLLRGFVDPRPLLKDIKHISAVCPWRHMRTPGGGRMSVAITNCGQFGWTSDRQGYQYRNTDPLTRQPWPAIPENWLAMAARAARAAGFDHFVPDSCLVNRYEAGTRLGLHRDQDEKDFAHPIVSVSLGAPARFVVGGMDRRAPTTPVMLSAGDVLVWGGADRLRYHGVGSPRREPNNPHPPTRFNLTFRRAR